MSWSWIAGGIYSHLSGRHIRDGAADLCRTLGVSTDEMRFGEVVGDEHGVHARVVLPHPIALIGESWAAFRAALGGGGGRGSIHLLWPLTCCLALLEGALFSAIANWRVFLAVCLPSSNGIFTARALGKMYGALANGGALADGTTVLRAATVAGLQRRAEDPAEDVPGWPAPGRNTCGFSPWIGAQVEDGRPHRAPVGRRLAILGHTGMGGCCAYADLTTGLALVVLKNAFTPEVLYGTGPGRTCALVDACLRRRLGELSPATTTRSGKARTSAAASSATSARPSRSSRSPRRAAN